MVSLLGQHRVIMITQMGDFNSRSFESHARFKVDTHRKCFHDGAFPYMFIGDNILLSASITVVQQKIHESPTEIEHIT